MGDKLKSYFKRMDNDEIICPTCKQKIRIWHRLKTLNRIPFHVKCKIPKNKKGTLVLDMSRFQIGLKGQYWEVDPDLKKFLRLFSPLLKWLR